MSHPSVMIREEKDFVHIFVDAGPEVLCDDCCEPCGDAPFGVRFGGYAVCPICAVERIRDGRLPDEISSKGEDFKAFCYRLNAPLRAKMDRLHAETN